MYVYDVIVYWIASDVGKACIYMSNIDIMCLVYAFTCLTHIRHVAHN